MCLHAQLNSSIKCDLLQAFVNTKKKIGFANTSKKSRVLIWQIDFSPVIIQNLFLSLMAGGGIHLNCLEIWKLLKLHHWCNGLPCCMIQCFPSVSLGGRLKWLWFERIILSRVRRQFHCYVKYCSNAQM